MAKARLKSAIGFSIKKTVPAGTTETVDSLALADFKGLRYFISSWNGSKTKVMDMSVRNTGSDVEDSVFGRTGDLPLQIAANLSGSDVLLEVTNPNAFDINVEVNRILMGQP